MKLATIINEIDKVLMDKVPFAPNRAFGLAEVYYEGEKYHPGIIDNKGNITNPFLDDQYAVSWYHRNQTGTYSIVESNYGNNLNKVEETNIIQLVIYTDRTKIKNSLETLKDVFISAIPSVLSKAICESIGVFGCEIELKSHELDTKKVFKEECSTEYVRAGVQYGLIAIRYEIKTVYRRGCEVTCEC